MDGIDWVIEVYGDAECPEVLAQRVPQAGVEVVDGHIKQQAFGRAGEVGVEHRDDLVGGKIIGWGKKRPREDFQGQVTCAVGKLEPVQELGGGFVVVAVQRLGELQVDEFKSAR